MLWGADDAATKLSDQRRVNRQLLIGGLESLLISISIRSAASFGSWHDSAPVTRQIIRQLVDWTAGDTLANHVRAHE